MEVSRVCGRCNKVQENEQHDLGNLLFSKFCIFLRQYISEGRDIKAEKGHLGCTELVQFLKAKLH